MTGSSSDETAFVHPDYVRAAVAAIQAAHAGGTRSVEFWDEVQIGLRAALPLALAAATARAEQAEALAAERVEAARQREETWRDSAMQANAELAKLRAVVQAADDVRIGHGGAWCAHCGKVMREGTIAVRAPHCVVCPGCAEQQRQDSEEGTT